MLAAMDAAAINRANLKLLLASKKDLSQLAEVERLLKGELRELAPGW